MIRSASLASFRVALLILLALFIFVFQSPLMLMHSRLSRRLPVLWHSWCRRIVGMEVVVYGRPLVKGPALFVANHISYLDVAAIGSVVDASFISRGDVRNWPIFGFLATLQRTVFVERKPRYVRQQMIALMARLAVGDRLILFPEGTSGDGTKILPFKSSLFAVAEITVKRQLVQVQPISIAYTRLDGMPLGRLMRPIYAWYGDMEFVSHLWRLLGFGRFCVEITLHDPVTLDQFNSRKELTKHCERVVTNGFSLSLSGRSGEPQALATVVKAPSTA